MAFKPTLNERLTSNNMPSGRTQHVDTLHFGFGAVEGLFDPSLLFVCIKDDLEHDSGSVALHELSHALTFMGAQFYAKIAARLLMGKRLILVPSLCEVIPEIFRRIRGRAERGTDPDPEIVNTILDCIRLLHKQLPGLLHHFSPSSIDPVPPTNASVAGITNKDNFDQTLALLIVRTAIDLSIDHSYLDKREDGEQYRAAVKKASDNARARIQDLHMKLTRGLVPGQSVWDIFPMPGSRLEDYIDRLMEREPRRIVDYGASIYLLPYILSQASDTALAKHAVLVPALFQMELVVQFWAPVFTATFFASPTADYRFRVERFLRERGGSKSNWPSISTAVGTLTNSLVNKFRIVPIPKQRDDERSWNLCRKLGLRQFLWELPVFLRFYVILEGDRDPHWLKELDCQLERLRTISVSRFGSYLDAVSEQAIQVDPRYRRTIREFEEAFTLCDSHCEPVSLSCVTEDQTGSLYYLKRTAEDE